MHRLTPKNIPYIQKNTECIDLVLYEPYVCLHQESISYVLYGGTL